MGGFCSCSRNRNKSSQSNIESQNDVKTSMLSEDGNALHIGSKNKNDKVSFKSLNKDDHHKAVHRIHGYDDTGAKHDNNKKTNKNEDDGYDSGDDDDAVSNDVFNDKERESERNLLNGEPRYLSSSSETLVVKNGGYSQTNGEYRWFVHSKTWCFFTETGTNYSISNNISVNKVYEQLKSLKSSNANFEWNKDIKYCWIISDMDASHIYYAAPMQYSDKIPSNFSWISVHGSNPAPIIFTNTTHDSQGPDDEDDSLTFGDRSVSSLQGRHPSSRMSKVAPLVEEDDANDQESPNDDDNDNDDDDDDGNDSDVSQMSE